MIKINVDFSDLIDLKDIGEKLRHQVNEANKQAGAMAYAKAVELAQERLRSRREEYLENLRVFEDGGVVIVELGAEATWIEDGMSEFDMKPGLLSSDKAKRAKDGSTYLAVPMKHGPGMGPTSTTPAQQDLIGEIKREFKRRKIPFAKIEKDSQGRPKLGMVHRLDVKTPAKTHHGPGQGKGPIGEQRQGKSGIPFLQNVNVYQSMKGDKVQKSIMTFRTVSSKQDADMWIHPGLGPTNIFKDTYDWIEETFEREILPKIVESFKV